MRAFANVSVDLDGIPHYHRIHGLEVPSDPRSIYSVALPRLLDLFGEHGVQATFFTIASDLESPVAVDGLRRAIQLGHEVASHTHGHPYDLREWSERGIAREIDQADSAIRSALGVRPVGFRTPGYNVDTRILRILAERGYRYDSSVFPCPPYWFAKAAVMTGMALVGRESGSAMTDPRGLIAPLQPYRPSRWGFWKPGDRKHSLPLWEIPMGVVPGLRFPVIGTSVGALSPSAVRVLWSAWHPGQRTLQFEMHAIDAMDHRDAAISPALAARQPDVRRAWPAKRAAFSTLFNLMKGRYSLVTLARLADELDAEHGLPVLS